MPVAVPINRAPGGGGHGHAVGAGDGAGLVLTSPLTTTLAVAALVLGAATAGVALLAPTLPRSRRIEIIVETSAAMLLGVLVIGWLGGMPLLALIPPALTAIAAAGLTHQGLRRMASAAGALLLALLALAVGGLTLLDRFGWPQLSRATFFVAAAVWLGAVLLAAAANQQAEPGVRRRLLARLALGAAVVVTVALAVRTWADGLRFDAVSVGSGIGLVTLGAFVLLVAAVALSVLGFGASARGRVVTATVVALVVVAGTVGSALTPPTEIPGSGQPLVRTIALDTVPDPATGRSAGAEYLGVAVVPQRPGTNLVHVSTPGVLVNGVPAQARIGAPGGWVALDLPAGTRELTLERAGDRERMRLDLGTEPAPAGVSAVVGGPDGPECLAAIVAASLNGRAVDSCPSQALETRDDAVIKAGVDFLAKRGAPRLHIIADDSPRAKAAAEVARRAAAARSLPVSDSLEVQSAVMVVAGWDYGGKRLTQEALGLSTVYGTYTAPWLATGSILGKQTGATTILDFDPVGDRAKRYIAVLRQAGMVGLAGTAGFRAWDGGPAQTGPRVFSAAQISIFPTGVGGGSHEDLDRWIPNGTLTPVTPPLPY